MNRFLAKKKPANYATVLLNEVFHAARQQSFFLLFKKPEWKFVNIKFDNIKLMKRYILP